MSVRILGLRVVRRIEDGGALANVAKLIPGGDIVGPGFGLLRDLRDEIARLFRQFDLRMTRRKAALFARGAGAVARGSSAVVGRSAAGRRAALCGRGQSRFAGCRS